MEKFVIKFFNDNNPLRYRSGRVSLADANNYHDNTSPIIHSDTVFSALINQVDMLYGNDKATETNKMFENSSIKLSSMNFYLENENNKIITWFLPVPAIKVLNIDNVRFYKGIKYISSEVYNSTINIKEWENKSKFQLLPGGLLITLTEMINLFGINENNTPTPLPYIYKKVTRFQNNISLSDNNDSQVYTQTFIEINNSLPNSVKAGIYFMIEFEDGLINKNNCLLKVLENCGSIGFGGEKNIIGRFENTKVISLNEKIKLNELFPSNNEKIDYYMNLGLLSPKDENEFNNVLYYQTEYRGGQNDGNGRRPLLIMIVEGAISSSLPTGKIHELRKGIYRYGCPISIPISNFFLNPFFVDDCIC
ncbi:MAG: hypothetical protein HUU47_10550 [Bacteroidetes bacterium]|nr:hypothetical protein [Bacteroidota bacterium]